MIKNTKRAENALHLNKDQEYALKYAMQLHIQSIQILSEFKIPKQVVENEMRKLHLLQNN